jgi:hypothetical protein
MQARPKIAAIFVVAFMVSLALGACGGGSTGKTWFNVPSINVRLQPDGTARVLGFNAGYVLDPALIQQMQTANVQKAEIRIGYGGIFIFINGEPLPYIDWSEEAVNTLQDVLVALPNVPNGQLIANALPWLRTFGLGVSLFLPEAGDIPAWNGVEPVRAEGSGGEPTIGPNTIGSLVFDSEGNLDVERIPAAFLEQQLGIALPSLDANTLSVLQSLDVQSMQISITPSGIDLTMDDRPLPGLAYTSETLERLGQYATAFVSDPAMQETVNRAITLLSSAQIDVAVSFTGEPVAETQLPTLPVAVQPDGSVEVFGLPVAQQAIPANTIQSLQRADVQQLSVDIGADGMVMAANGQALPTISWTDESLQTLANIAGPMAGVSPDLINTGFGIVRTTGLQADVALPLAEGATAIEMPAEIDTTMEPPAADTPSPTIHVRAAYDDQQFASLGNLTAEELASLGINVPDLPPALSQTLTDLGVSEVTLRTDPNALNVVLDGETALTINYDTASLEQALELAAPFLGDTPLNSEPLLTLLREQILRLAPNADVEVTLVVQ